MEGWCGCEEKGKLGLMVFDNDCTKHAKVHGNQDMPCSLAYPKGTLVHTHTHCTHTSTILPHALSSVIHITKYCHTHTGTSNSTQILFSIQPY